MLRTIVIGLMMLGLVPQLMAQSQSDSLSMATATVWGHSLKQQVERNFAGDTMAINAYVKGIADAFGKPTSDAPYHTGVLQGLVLAQRIVQMQNLGLDIDVATFCKSLGQFLKGNSTEFTRESANEYINECVARMTPADTVDAKAEQSFIDKQLQRSGVVKTASGLVFETLVEGVGEHPALNGKVKLLYTGRLSDGTVFDSTEEPVIFDVARLVKGFTEGLLLMRPGGIYRLFIPAELGYGAKGIEGAIPGNAALDFEVKLLEVITK